MGSVSPDANGGGDGDGEDFASDEGELEEVCSSGPLEVEMEDEDIARREILAAFDIYRASLKEIWTAFSREVIVVRVK